MRPSLLLLLHHPVSLLFLAWLPLPCPGVVPVKSGTCPVLQANEILCGLYCSRNDSCPGNEICCVTTCGQQCELPEGVDSGYCPRVDLGPGQATNCISSCSSDTKCAAEPPKKKCCNIGCQEACIEAIEEHPGACPLRQVVQTFAPCKDTCDDDRDCLHNQKCCFTGCSRGCLDTVRSKQCRLPPERGPCAAVTLRFYYSVDQNACLEFSFGGCHGNSNNFRTEEECERTCRRTRSSYV